MLLCSELLSNKGKPSFVDVTSFAPYPDQWTLLQSVDKLSESVLDEIIEMNNLSSTPPCRDQKLGSGNEVARYGLPICVRKMLRDGVSQHQRTSCFRLAVHLKRLGLPYEAAEATLKTWALKNKPINGKEVIQESEIVSQTRCAYDKSYAGYGCGSEAMQPFCEPSCPVKQWRERT